MSLLEPSPPKKAFLQNKQLVNTFLMWSLRYLKAGLSTNALTPQISLVLVLAPPVQKMVFLCRLPARLVWSTGVPRPDGSAAGSEPERHEQPTRNSGAKCDGLLPNHVFLSGARQQGYKIAGCVSTSMLGGARHSHYL